MTEPNPYEALKRVRGLKPPAQRRLLRLRVWCENNQCTPVRVFSLRDGLLVECRSDADNSDAHAEDPSVARWRPRPAFFLDAWFAPEGYENDHPYDRSKSHLQVVCDCLQTTPRLVDVQRLTAAIPVDGEKTRNVSLPDVAATNG